MCTNTNSVEIDYSTVCDVLSFVVDKEVLPSPAFLGKQETGGQSVLVKFALRSVGGGQMLWLVIIPSLES